MVEKTERSRSLDSTMTKRARISATKPKADPTPPQSEVSVESFKGRAIDILKLAEEGGIDGYEHALAEIADLYKAKTAPDKYLVLSRSLKSDVERLVDRLKESNKAKDDSVRQHNKLANHITLPWRIRLYRYIFEGERARDYFPK